MAKKILIIDDEQDFVETLSFSLQSNGFEVDNAPNGPSGIEMLKTQKADAVVLDLMMPGMDGYEVARKLKSNQATANIPIIVLTAAVTPDLKQKIQQIQAVGHMTKPCDLEELTEKLKKILEA